MAKFPTIQIQIETTRLNESIALMAELERLRCVSLSIWANAQSMVTDNVNAMNRKAPLRHTASLDAAGLELSNLSVAFEQLSDQCQRLNQEDE